MDFTINAKAEGRVVVPWEHVAYPNLTQDGESRRALFSLFLSLLSSLVFGSLRRGF
jgi:hypothetical protein